MSEVNASLCGVAQGTINKHFKLIDSQQCFPTSRFGALEDHNHENLCQPVHLTRLSLPQCPACSHPVPEDEVPVPTCLCQPEPAGGTGEGKTKVS